MNTQHTATAGYMGLFNIYPGLSKSSRELLSVWIFDANLLDFTQLSYYDELLCDFIQQEKASQEEEQQQHDESNTSSDHTSTTSSTTSTAAAAPAAAGEEGKENNSIPRVGSFTTAVSEEIIEIMHKDFNMMLSCKEHLFNDQEELNSDSPYSLRRHRASTFANGNSDIDGIIMPLEVVENSKSAIVFTTERIVCSLSDILNNCSKVPDGLIEHSKFFEANRSLSELLLTRGLQTITRALQYLHNIQQCIHNSITPENIVITATGKFKLCGFGFHLTAIPDLNTNQSLIVSMPYFRSISVIQDPSHNKYCLEPNLQYVSPEVTTTTSDGVIGIESDYFALGVTFYELFQFNDLLKKNIPLPKYSSLIKMKGNSKRKHQEIMSSWSEYLKTIEMNGIPESMKDLFQHLLLYHPKERATSKSILHHIMYQSPQHQLISMVDNMTIKTDSIIIKTYIDALVNDMKKLSPRILLHAVIPIISKRCVEEPSLWARSIKIHASVAKDYLNINRKQFRLIAGPYIALGLAVTSPPEAIQAFLENIHFIVAIFSKEYFQANATQLFINALKKQNLHLQKLALSKLLDSETMNIAGLMTSSFVAEQLIPILQKEAKSNCLSSLRQQCNVAINILVEKLPTATRNEVLAQQVANGAIDALTGMSLNDARGGDYPPPPPRSGEEEEEEEVSHGGGGDTPQSVGRTAPPPPPLTLTYRDQDSSSDYGSPSRLDSGDESSTAAAVSPTGQRKDATDFHNIENSNNSTPSKPNQLKTNQLKTNHSFYGKDQHITAFYDLGPLIGKGKYATVRQGMDRSTGGKVAVKVIEKKDLRYSEISIKKEVEILSKLKHPNIVKMYDMFDEENHFYMVLECINGGALFDRIARRTKYTEHEARNFFISLLSAVKHCHDHNIVHRDIKPENLMMTSYDDNADVKIVDFGFAAVVEGTTLTDRCGTPYYISPELLNRIPHGKPVDMWALGVVLFLLLSGHAPFQDVDLRNVYAKIKAGKFEFSTEQWDHISDHAKSLIGGLLTVDQHYRLTADEALSHPWIKTPSEHLNHNTLDFTIKGLRKYQATAKFKAGVLAVQAITRMKRRFNRRDYTDVAKSLPMDMKSRYEITEKVLGKGGYATVKEGTSKIDYRRVAIKIIHRNGLKESTERNLRREVDILNSLHHRNIVKTYDFIEETDNFYMILEYIDGGELFDRIIKKKRFNEKEARDLAVVMLRAIKHCHDNKIAHRDLKPENVLMTSHDDDAELKIVDFGFAAKCDGDSLTNQCGTPAYIAPEILSKKPHGVAVDMWSFGVILYILLAGYPPFRDRDEKQLFRKIRAGAYEFHQKYWTNVSLEGKDLIKRLLTVNPVNRATVDQALGHPWVHADPERLSSNDLSSSLSELELFQGNRRFKATVNAVIAMNRMSKLISGGIANSNDRDNTIDTLKNQPSSMQVALDSTSGADKSKLTPINEVKVEHDGVDSIFSSSDDQETCPLPDDGGNTPLTTRSLQVHDVTTKLASKHIGKAGEGYVAMPQGLSPLPTVEEEAQLKPASMVKPPLSPKRPTGTNKF